MVPFAIINEILAQVRLNECKRRENLHQLHIFAPGKNLGYVNWEGMLDMKINDFLSTNIRVELIYDDDIDILTEVQDDGTEIFGPRMQIKQLFALGVNFKF